MVDCKRNTVPTLKDIRAAAERIAPYAHHTPVITCRSIDERLGANFFFKCENLQKVGAFKFRGACNAVFSLSDAEAAKGVVCHSSGNHAQALALAARLRGAPAYIVMPSNAPAVKKAAVEGYGGRITFCEPALAARESTQAQVIRATGATEVRPYNNYNVIAGAGTAALELLEQAPDLAVIMTPVGGGGLLSGTSLTVSELSPHTAVIAGEPEMADDAFRSLAAGKIIPSEHPKTIADGLLTSLGTLTFPIIQMHVRQIVTASEHAIIAAMKFFWERTKIMIEPSSAVPLACLIERSLDLGGLRVGVILSGGNVDLERLPWQA